jgi:putative transposase
MIKKRRRFSASEKAKIALEALKGVQTINEIAQKFDVHPTMVNKWRRELIDRVPELFSERPSAVNEDKTQLIDELYKQIGQLTVECDWLKKKANQIG